MKRRQLFIRIIVPAVSLLILAAIMAFTFLKPDSRASTDEEYFTQMLKDGNYDELLEQLRSAYAGSEFDDMLAGVVQAVAKNATPGMRFIDRLHEHNDLIIKSLEANVQSG